LCGFFFFRCVIVSFGGFALFVFGGAFGLNNLCFFGAAAVALSVFCFLAFLGFVGLLALSTAASMTSALWLFVTPALSS
jgi:hypothetical protein